MLDGWRLWSAPGEELGSAGNLLGDLMAVYDKQDVVDGPEIEKH